MHWWITVFMRHKRTSYTLRLLVSWKSPISYILRHMSARTKYWLPQTDSSQLQLFSWQCPLILLLLPVPSIFLILSRYFAVQKHVCYFHISTLTVVRKILFVIKEVWRSLNLSVRTKAQVPDTTKFVHVQITGGHLAYGDHFSYSLGIRVTIILFLVLTTTFSNICLDIPLNFCSFIAHVYSFFPSSSFLCLLPDFGFLHILFFLHFVLDHLFFCLFFLCHIFRLNLHREESFYCTVPITPVKREVEELDTIEEVSRVARLDMHGLPCQNTRGCQSEIWLLEQKFNCAVITLLHKFKKLETVAWVHSLQWFCRLFKPSLLSPLVCLRFITILLLVNPPHL